MPQNEVTILAVLQDRLSTPLTRIKREFTDFTSKVGRLDQALAPLTGRFAQLVQGVLSVQGIRQSLDAAERQVQAERQVLAALEGQVEAQKELLALSSEIQSNSVIGDEALLEQEAILLRMGVAADQIPRAIQAAVDTAAALGKELPTVARAIGQSLTLNRAGFIGRDIEILKDLETQGTLSVRVLDELEEAFGGAAAEFADTDFGRQQQQLNILGDQLERVGRVLIQIVLPVLEEFVRITTRAADVFESSAFLTLVDFFDRLGPLIARAVTGILAFSAGLLAIKAASVTVTTLFALVTSLTGAVVGLVTAFNGIPLILAVVLVRFEETDSILSSLASKVQELFGSLRGLGSGIVSAFRSVRDGEASVDELGIKIEELFTGFVDLFNAYLIQPIIDVGTLAVQITDGIFRNVRFNLEALGRIIVRTFARIFTEVFELSADIFDSLPESIRDKINQSLSGGASFGVQIDLGDFLRSSREFDIIDEEVENLIAKGAEGTQDIIDGFSGFSTVFDEIENRIDRAQNRAIRAIDNIQGFSEQQANDPQFRRQRLVNEAVIQVDTRENIRDLFNETTRLETKLEDIRLNVTTLFSDLSSERIREVLQAFDDQTSQVLRENLSTEINRQFESQEISAKEFFELRRTLETTLIDTQIAGAEAVLEETRTRIQEATAELEANRQVRLEAELVINEDLFTFGNFDQLDEAVSQVTRALKEEEATQLRVNQLNESLVRSTQNLNTLVAERIGITQELENQESQTVRAIVDVGREARNELTQQRLEIATLLDNGLPAAEGLRLEREAVEEFRSTINVLKLELIDLESTVPPNVAEEIRNLQEALDDLNASGTEGKLTFENEDFFGTLRKSAEETARNLGDLELQAANLGSTLVQAFSVGLVDALFDADTSLKEFGANFLLLISRLIAQLLVFKAVASTLGVLGGFFGAPGLGSPDSTLQPVPRNEGGWIPGPNVDEDVVPALLTPGEFVLNRTSSSIIPNKLLTFLNSIRSASDLTKLESLSEIYKEQRSSITSVAKSSLNTGGAVTTSAPSPGSNRGGAGVVVPAVSGSYQMFDQLLNGGGVNALLDIMGRNRDTFRSILGVQ